MRIRVLKEVEGVDNITAWSVLKYTFTLHDVHAFKRFRFNSRPEDDESVSAVSGNQWRKISLDSHVAPSSSDGTQ